MEVEEDSQKVSGRGQDQWGVLEAFQIFKAAKHTEASRPCKAAGEDGMESCTCIVPNKDLSVLVGTGHYQLTMVTTVIVKCHHRQN